MNVNFIPAYKDFYKAFQSPPHNTVDGKHYGISIQFGPNVLMYNTKSFPKRPTSWSTIYRAEQGQDHDPGQPDPDRGRGALSLEDEAVRSGSRIRTS